jgi:hypothetical protein
MLGRGTTSAWVGSPQKGTAGTFLNQMCAKSTSNGHNLLFIW